jgi:hypothetical protein
VRDDVHDDARTGYTGLATGDDIQPTRRTGCQPLVDESARAELGGGRRRNLRRRGSPHPADRGLERGAHAQGPTAAESLVEMRPVAPRTGVAGHAVEPLRLVAECASSPSAADIRDELCSGRQSGLPRSAVARGTVASSSAGESTRPRRSIVRSMLLR